MGLAESAVAFFPDAAWQRCVVHWYRNIFSHVPSTKVREIAAMLKAIYGSEDIVAAREKAVRVIDKLRGLRLAKAAELAEAAIEETLTYYAFPEEHWRRIRTTDEMDKDFFAIRRTSSPFFCSTRGGRSSVPTAHLRPPRARAVKAGRVYRAP